MSQNSFSEQLKTLRKAANLTQQLFADQLNVHLQTVSKWERGITEPDISLLGDIAYTLDVSVGQLIAANGEEVVVGNFSAARLGANISQLRHAAGQDQKTLAKVLCVSADTVSKWERAKNCPDIDSLVALAKHFSVSLSALYCGKALPATTATKGKNYRKVWIPILAAVVVCLVTLGLVLGLLPQNGGNIQAASGNVSSGNTHGNNVAHLCDFGEWQIAEQPTCTKAGTEVRVCSVCNAEESRLVAATGHSYEIQVVASTCIRRGYTLHTCNSCGNSYSDTYTDLLPHQYVFKSQKAPTCTRAGSDVFECTYCKSTKTSTVNATGHTYEVEVVASTCSAQGYTLHTCTACGNFYKDNYTDVLPHNFVFQSQNDPTCTQSGSKLYVCSVCKTTQTTPIPATGHTYTQSQQPSTCLAQGYTLHTCNSCGHFYKDNYLPLCEHSPEALAAVEPTCVSNGLSQGQRCSVCHKILVQQDIVPALGHTFESGTCTRCSFTVTPTDQSYFTFTLKGDGTYEITAAREDLPEEVVIPWSYNGADVTSIGIRAFSANSAVKSIIIPQSITLIENSAIHGNTSLHSVYYMGSVSQWLQVEIADYNFMHAHSLYFNGELLTDLVYPSGLSVVKRNHFHYCSSLKTITFTEDVVEIQYYAFEFCTNAESVFIPYTVLTVGAHAFSFTAATINCQALFAPDNWDSSWNYGSYNVVWGYCP